MKRRNSPLFIVLYIIAWIIFVGVSIEAGGFIVSSVGTAFYGPEGARHLWKQADLSSLYAFNQSHFITLSIVICIVAVLRAILFYIIIKLMHDKKFDPTRPFRQEIARFIFPLAYLSFLIGLFSTCGTRFSGWLAEQGVDMPLIQDMLFDGADVWIFMAVVLFVIAQVFKRGIELQTENDLTV